MHRIDTSGNVDNRFHPGNPATGQQATLVDQDWLNAVQEEIVGVIDEANIPLEKGNNTQLAAAIVALIAGVVGDGSGAVPTTRQLLVAGGLLTGGGNLAADRTIGLAAATTGEAAAQIRNDVVVTPASLAGLVSLTQVGGAWIIRIGPVIAQIFSGTVGANTTTVLTLPQAFPTEARAAFVNGGRPISTADSNGPYVNGVGLSSVSIYSALDISVAVDVIIFGR
ncbi:hypothetical protein [Erythrobacter colymbi]|uniref:hypothetical protein n=1 Tax=Erythrobacter colymbi TaxID=1161202 RepID=UPI000A3754A4|nr:hypothetical protein [Erythrobacter colymbi]